MDERLGKDRLHNHDIYCFAGKPRADRIMSEIKARPIRIISDISDALFEEAGRLNFEQRIFMEIRQGEKPNDPVPFRLSGCATWQSGWPSGFPPSWE
jgi:hypothetical protein